MRYNWNALTGAFLILPSFSEAFAGFEQSRASTNITLAYSSTAILNATVTSNVSSVALSHPAPSAVDTDSKPSLQITNVIGNTTISPHTSSLMNIDIKRYAALGDSYAAGVGSGKHTDHHNCGRGDLSYPYLLNVDLRGGKHNLKKKDKSFDFTACAGANVDYVRRRQMPKLTGKYDLITLTIGGNDINFVNLVNDCVFGWLAKPLSKCYKTMGKAELLMPKATKDAGELLDDLIAKHLTEDGQIYVTGYGKLFNDETEQCDNVNLAFWGAKKPLTRERRKMFNHLGDLLNGAIKAAVMRAGPRATFVHYDLYVEMCKGRMCEADAKEPDFKRKATMIFEQGGPTIGSSPSSRLNIGKEIGVRDGISTIIPDKVLRTAHPRPNGHRLIADLILWEMDVKKSEKLGLPPPEKPGHEICGADFAVEEEKDSRETRHKIAKAIKQGHTFGYVDEEVEPSALW